MNLVLHSVRFVVQRHLSRSPHFDFRLEQEGVFKSWAVPKGVPQKSGIKHLAIQVDDHTLEFGDFEGIIPAGDYGAGAVTIWDRGTYVLHQWDDNRIVFTLSGQRVQGTYNLIRFRHKGKREWLLFKSANDRSGEED